MLFTFGPEHLESKHNTSWRAIAYYGTSLLRSLIQLKPSTSTRRVSIEQD